MTKFISDKEIENRLVEAQKLEKKLFDLIEDHKQSQTISSTRKIKHYTHLYSTYLVK